ncbi:hypothetical protein F4802DRAFT_501645 [Xylaria palmicola]|nr:hypothetical protein F4802DRAFT_501645 [Xylaria palmicola]
MGGGIKSKFRFPIPGRPSKKQEPPTLSVSAPLSKAQRILGADGINIGPPKLKVDPGRSWETGSNGGISISVSESSQATQDAGFDPEIRRRARWEEESAIIPRQVRSAHSSGQRGLTTKPYTVENPSRDNITNTSTRGRRMSSSTIDTHYDSAKMPLAISQQTSNSAMAKGLPAKGLPAKVNELLDIDGSLAGQDMGKRKKKKPTRLDFSRLRPKGYRERNRSAPSIEPILGNNYVENSPSFISNMSQTPESAMLADSTARASQTSQQERLKQQRAVARQSPRSKGITEATGLHRLYHNYEQMSFQSEGTLEEEADREHVLPLSERGSNKPRPASTFAHSLLAPLPSPPPRGRDTSWRHSRNDSYESRINGSIADSSSGLQVHAVSRKDYSGSISSRHTRTSKASPSSKSIVESDRLQCSVLSLSDSSDEGDMEPISPSSLSRRESAPHDAALEASNPSKGQHNPRYLPGTASPRRFTPSLNQVDEHLAARSTPRIQTSRSPSSNTLRSSHSSRSTLTASHLTPSAPDSRLSSRSTETMDTLGSSNQPGYGVQQARAVSFVSLASTVEAASKVSMSENAHHLGKVLRQDSNATSRISHSSDQPTPPLSPNSVEFYVKSRESLQRDAMASDSSEAHNARLMAVTRQEEMLLAALRQKRAKMRETAISEAEEDAKSRTSHSSRGSLGSAKRSNTNSGKGVVERSTMPKHHTASTSTSWPKRSSSLFMGVSRENLRQADQQNGLHKELRDVDVPSATSRSDVTERTSTSATGSTTSTTFDSRNDQNLLYFDQPTDSTNTADSSVDFSDDYMEDSDGEDLIVNERRTSRMQSRRDSASGTTRGSRTGSAGSRRESSSHSSHSSQYRKDSTATHPSSASRKGHRLQDVPEVEVYPEYNEDVDADDTEEDGLDDFPQPPMPPPTWPLPPRPDVPKTKPNDLPSGTSFLHPSSARQKGHSPERKPKHLKGKKSTVRLSAVGNANSLLPWQGDDD